MLVVGSESKLDQRPRVRNHFGLPSVVGLVALHGSLRSIVPDARWLALKVMLTNQRFLNISGAFGIDFLLSAPPARRARFFPFTRMCLRGVLRAGACRRLFCRSRGDKAARQHQYACGAHPDWTRDFQFGGRILPQKTKPGHKPALYSIPDSGIQRQSRPDKPLVTEGYRLGR